MRDYTFKSTWLQKDSYIKICARNIPRALHLKRQDLRGSKQMGLRQAADEGLSYPVYIVQKHVSSNIARLKKP